jgi:general secretion pathway protein G
LVSLVSVNFLPTLSNAYIEVAKQDISRLQQALVMFKINEGKYPNSSQGLESLKTNPGNLRNSSKYPNGGYINKIPVDPWGNNYVYIFPGQNSEYDIVSLGADGQPGGEGENADIGNWSQ